MDNNNTNPLYTDPAQQVENNLYFNTDPLSKSDPLELKIKDEDLSQIVKERIAASKKFFEDKYDLTERRRRNEKYLFSRQVSQAEREGKLKDYETRSADNVLYEIENLLKALAMATLPDIIVTPGGDDDQRRQSAKDLTLVIDDTNKKREQRNVLELGFKHLPVYFTAIIKARWDAEKGTDGDYRFDIIHPEYVIVDHTATTKNVDDMSFVAHCTPMTVQDAVMRFPKKKKELFDELQIRGMMVGTEPTWKDMASEIKIWEVWFDWYRKVGSDELVSKAQMTEEIKTIDEPGVKWEKIAGVLWKYEDCILNKMLDPNFDHEGEQKIYSYANPADETSKQEVSEQDLLMSAVMGVEIPNMQNEQIYHNYFRNPHKPFYFFGYDQWGKIPYDETSRIEQNIRNQQNLDDQNKTVLDQLKTRVKHIWSEASGMTKSDVQRLDMDDPKMDVMVEGSPNEVHKAIMPERPDAAQFNSLKDTRDRMYALSGTTAIRGQMQSQVATTNQIAREANFTQNDNLVEDTINEAAEWMAQWQMQFIKLRYTNEHLKEILGSTGETTYIKLRRDTIADGMEVMIKSSSTDKLKAQRNAMETAALGPPYSNPLDFFTDMGMTDPEGRTERGVMYAADPMGYFTKYILKLDNTQQQAMALTAGIPGGQPPPVAGQPAPQGAPPAPDTSQMQTAPQGSVRGV